MDTIIPENEFISMNTLERYIEKHPEDAEKWYEFVNEKIPDNIRRFRYRDSNNESTIQDLREIYLLAPVNPVESHIDGCLVCRHSWDSSKVAPTTTLLCGHTYHTVCQCIRQYQDMDRFDCLVDGCTLNTWSYVRKLVQVKEVREEQVENLLIDTYKQRKDFKEDIKELKSYISAANLKYNKVQSLISLGKKTVIHKHLYSINNIHRDMKEAVDAIKNGEDMHNYKSAVSKYRKKAYDIFRKYHVSSRELRQKHIIRYGWRMQRVLERHGIGHSFYKFGIRIYPNKKEFKDPI
jgi:hypothetical protein